jgi:tetratricopeptide (TPR) repeat protein
MQFIKNHWLAEIIGLVILLLVAGGCWYYFAKVRVPAIPINPNDTIASWSFKSLYAGNDALTAQTNADIARLSGLLGKGQYPDYELFVGIAQDYDYLGDGKTEFQYLEKAIVAGPTGGVAWNNLGVLMEKLGALNTARAAYAQAVAVEPTVGAYQEAQLRFLTANFPQDTSAIETAFQNGMKNSADANLIPLEAYWLSSIGSTTAAISAWKEFATYVPASQQAAIDAEIAKLEAKR